MGKTVCYDPDYFIGLCNCSPYFNFGKRTRIPEDIEYTVPGSYDFDFIGLWGTFGAFAIEIIVSYLSSNNKLWDSLEVLENW